MSSLLAPLARTRALLVAGSAAAVLTGCGAGFQPLTYEERNSSTATEIEVGGLQVLDVALEAPEEVAHEAGETVNGSLAVINTTGEDDRLVSITSDAARAVALLEDSRPVEVIDVPAESALVNDSIGFALVGITDPLRAGEYVEITLLFEKNGAETVLVPVRTPEGTPEREHSDVVHGEEEAH